MDAPEHVGPTLDVTQGYAIQDALLARHVADGRVDQWRQAGSHEPRQAGRDAGPRAHRRLAHGPDDVGSRRAAGRRDRWSSRAASRRSRSCWARTWPARTSRRRMSSAATASPDGRDRGPRLALSRLPLHAARRHRGRRIRGPVRGRAAVAPDAVDLRRLWRPVPAQRPLVGTATGAAVMGDPAEAVAWWVRHLARSGRGLRAGMVVLSGALMGAHTVAAGDVVTATHRRPRHARARVPMTRMNRAARARGYHRLRVRGRGARTGGWRRRASHGLAPAFVHVRERAQPRVPPASRTAMLLRDLEPVPTRRPIWWWRPRTRMSPGVHGERMLETADYLPLSVTALADDDLRATARPHPAARRHPAAAATWRARRRRQPGGVARPVAVRDRSGWRSHRRAWTCPRRVSGARDITEPDGAPRR